MSANSSTSVNFDASEFSAVFKRINGYQNKQGFYCVRLLDKFHSAQFEACLKSARLNFENLESLANSRLADQIRFLTVFVPNDLSDLNDLHYVSPTFFSNIEKVNIVFTEGQYADKSMTLSQPLIFRGVNFIHDVSKQGINVPHVKIVSRNQDIQIIDCNFEGICLYLDQANNVTVENSTFKNAEVGLSVEKCQSKVSINKIYVYKCEVIGCLFNGVNEVNLNEVEIVDCVRGIGFFGPIVNIQNSIIDARSIGLESIGSTVNYRETSIKQTDGSERPFTKIQQVDSVINEIL